MMKLCPLGNNRWLSTRQEKDRLKYATFIDLKKAYDSVSREIMWLALSKLGILDLIVKLFTIKIMWVNIQLDGTVTEGIDLQNGLRQGCCCMAPVLFNLYTCLVMEGRLSKVEGMKK